ncbi:MAG: sodium:calcium antiporter [Gammaproteobacteria bacterium]|nr:MAG: sodium:calcium antiporter [Gammaproteobacteria bacterium]
MLLLHNFLILCFGLAILIWGADRFVAQSSIIAKRIGVSDLIIGLTLVAFGTSAPEIFIGISGIFNESAALSLGTVIGSNISNIALIFGIACFSLRKQITDSLINLLPFVISVVWLGIALFNGKINHIEAIVFIGILGLFLFTLFKSNDLNEENIQNQASSIFKDIFWLTIGLIGLIFGSHLSVTHAENIALILGVPEMIIGLTILALGTSLPELAASVAALVKKKAQMVVGNIIGSNIFNLVFVVPMIGFFSTLTLEDTIFVRDFLVLAILSTAFIAAIMVLKFAAFKGWVMKFFGLTFVGSYIAYIMLLSGLI